MKKKIKDFKNLQYFFKKIKGASGNDRYYFQVNEIEDDKIKYQLGGSISEDKDKFIKGVESFVKGVFVNEDEILEEAQQLTI